MGFGEDATPGSTHDVGRADAAPDADETNEIHTDMRLIAVALALLATPAVAHDWIEDGGYRSANDIRCCSESVGDNGGTPDCAAIPDSVAWESRIGSVVHVQLSHGTYPTTINVIYASADPRARAMACTTGCLFRPPGM
mgnify:FL=1